MRTPYYPKIGERVPVTGCYSEVMMHFRLAGQPIEVALLPPQYLDGTPATTGYTMAQVYKDGRPFSSSILPGEAGFYQDEHGYYTYPREELCPTS